METPTYTRLRDQTVRPDGLLVRERMDIVTFACASVHNVHSLVHNVHSLVFIALIMSPQKKYYCPRFLIQQHSRSGALRIIRLRIIFLSFITCRILRCARTVLLIFKCVLRYRRVLMQKRVMAPGFRKYCQEHSTRYLATGNTERYWNSERYHRKYSRHA